MTSSRKPNHGATARRGKRASRPHRTPRAAAESLRNKAYEAIKHRIITCAFKPGEYINELQLSSVHKIGRTPVHQALDRLMVEGLVQVIPRKGVIVKPVSLNEVLQIIEVRLINEPFLARLAAEHRYCCRQNIGRPAQYRVDDVARSRVSPTYCADSEKRRADGIAAHPA
jgi:DNA-binding transcriptional MocR family regulator